MDPVMPVLLIMPSRRSDHSFTKDETVLITVVNENQKVAKVYRIREVSVSVIAISSIPSSSLVKVVTTKVFSLVLTSIDRVKVPAYVISKQVIKRDSSRPGLVTKTIVMPSKSILSKKDKTKTNNTVLNPEKS